MIKNLAKGYKKFISVVGKILLLSLLCLGLGFCIVFPLWKWASTSPTIYSWTIVALIGAFFIYLCISLFRKKGGARFFFGLSKIILILGGLSLSIYFVLKSNRIPAIVVLISTFVLYGILSSISSSVLGKRKSNQQTNEMEN